jgi:hypothetical protein
MEIALDATEARNVLYRIFVVKIMGKDLLRVIYIYRWKYNIKVVHREMRLEGGERIQLAQERFQ